MHSLAPQRARETMDVALGLVGLRDTGTLDFARQLLAREQHSARQISAAALGSTATHGGRDALGDSAPPAAGPRSSGSGTPDAPASSPTPGPSVPFGFRERLQKRARNK